MLWLTVKESSVVQDKREQSRNMYSRFLLSCFNQRLLGFLRLQLWRCYAVPLANSKCYYESLNLKPGASSEQIKDAYYKLSKKYHPDMNSNNPDATGKFQEINEAFEVLGNASKKAEYDNKIMVFTTRKSKGSYIYDMEEPKFYYHKAERKEKSFEDVNLTGFKVVRRPGSKTAKGIAKRKATYAGVNAYFRKQLTTQKFSKLLF